jgi:hypothetical protein
MTMKNTLFIALSLLAVSAFGQTALTSTTVTNAITVNQQTFAVASSSAMTAGITKLYIIDKGGQGRGELVTVTAVNSSTSITVSRGSQFRAPHVALSVAVIIPSAQAIQNYDPVGSCVAANTLYTPWINQANGKQWLCSTLTLAWVPGFNNSDEPKNVTADVASAAGLVTVTSPLFFVTGTQAITGWTLPATFVGGSFCTIPEGAYTTTNATNIAIASTATAGKLLCFTWDTATTKWYPTY